MNGCSMPYIVTFHHRKKGDIINERSSYFRYLGVGAPEKAEGAPARTLGPARPLTAWARVPGLSAAF